MGRAQGNRQAVTATPTRRGSSAPATMTAVPNNWPEGTTLDDLPRAFKPNQPYFMPAIVDAGVAKLPGLTRRPVNERQLLDRLLADIPGATGLEEHARTVAVTGLPLQALVVERVPEWAKDHRQNRQMVGTRYGAHMGIGIYAYDPGTDQWFKRVLHGRSTCAAVRFPLKTVQAAVKKLPDLKAQVASNTFEASAIKEGYPKPLLDLDALLQQPLIDAEEQRQQQQQELRAQQRRERAQADYAERERLAAQEAQREAEREEQDRLRRASMRPDQLLQVTST